MTTKYTTGQIIIFYVLMAIVLIAFIGPILWFIALALRPPATSFNIPPDLNFSPTTDAFNFTFVDPGNNFRQLINSIIVATGATLFCLPFAMAAAYALSRFRIRSKKFIMAWYISLLMAPPIVFLIPYFVLMTRIGWAGTYQSMIVILQTITIPFSVWLLKSFIDDVPVDLEEAALVDGANRFVALVRVTLPLALPGIIVTAMFAFVFSWNNVVFPLVLSRQSTATLPVGTLGFFATTGINWNYIAATAVVTMIVPMIIFLVLGRYIVRGLTFGAVKG